MGLLANGLGILALRTRRPWSYLLGGTSLALAVRSVTNLPWKRLTGVGAGRKAVEIKKTIHINAPVEDVYAFWTDFENFPKYMANVSSIKVAEHNVSHWCARGPLGFPVRWDAEVTSHIPNQLFAWKSTPGAWIRNAGIIHFDRENDGTRVHLQMHYNPPGGAIAHAVARLLKSDPKAKLDDDLVRMKTFLETGKPARDSAQQEGVAKAV